MPVIELDLMLAYIVAEDRHHSIASAYFSKVATGSLDKPAITPFALQELELGIRAKRILPKGRPAKRESDVASFMSEVCSALGAHRVKVQPLACGIFAKAAEFREEYRLTYFDSLHASSTFFQDKEIVSTDSDYDRVTEIRRTDPYKL